MLTVVVHKVGNSDTEQGTLQPGIQTTQTFAFEDPLDSLDDVRVGLLRLNLRSGRQCNQGVSALVSAIPSQTSILLAGWTDVRAIDSSPPPAPASACATLSLCCAATACAEGDPVAAFCACACGSVEAGSGFEGVGAGDLYDMMEVFRGMVVGSSDCDGGQYRLYKSSNRVTITKARVGRCRGAVKSKLDFGSTGAPEYQLGCL